MIWMKDLFDAYKDTEPKFYAGVELSNGTTVTFGFIHDTGDGYVVRREGGRMDYIPKMGVSCIRIDNLSINPPQRVSVKAPGPEVVK